MKKILFMMAMACLLIGGTVVYGLADSKQTERQTGDSTYAETMEQGMMGQRMMGTQAMGMDEAPCWGDSDGDAMPYRMGMMNHMMGPYAMGGNMSGMMGGMYGGPIGMPMMAQQDLRDFYLDRVNELALSADQVAKLKTLRSEYRKENIQNVSELTINRMELAELLNSNDWSLKDAETLVRKIQKMEADFQVHQLQAAIDARKVLTPQQLAQIKENDSSYEHECHFG